MLVTRSARRAGERVEAVTIGYNNYYGAITNMLVTRSTKRAGERVEAVTYWL